MRKEPETLLAGEVKRAADFGKFLDSLWATATRQPAGQASPGANKLSPPFGDHQAQGSGR